LRQFSAVWLLFFGGLGLHHWLVRHNPTTALALTIAAAVVGTLGLIRPALVRPVFVASLIVSFPIGWVVSRVLISVMFFVVLTPVAVFFRWRRRDLLRLERQRGRDSYWQPKATDGNAASYFRQY
jgi:hypothetical protein